MFLMFRKKRSIALTNSSKRYSKFPLTLPLSSSGEREGVRGRKNLTIIQIILGKGVQNENQSGCGEGEVRSL
jgi:hypothetical protein